MTGVRVRHLPDFRPAAAGFDHGMCGGKKISGAARVSAIPCVAGADGAR
jgi:hypothetical protein